MHRRIDIYAQTHTKAHGDTQDAYTHTYKKMHREAHNTHIQKTYGTDTKIERNTHTPGLKVGWMTWTIWVTFLVG